jgi:hypothetical protein
LKNILSAIFIARAFLAVGKIGFQLGNIVVAANEAGTFLMYAGGSDVKKRSGPSVNGLTACCVNYVSHWSRLVQELQVSVGMILGIRRIRKDSTVKQGSMNV